MQKNRKKHLLEITVAEAARRMQLSERSIQNYLKVRKIKAVKVGREWYIDFAALEAFAQQHGFFFDSNIDAIKPAANVSSDTQPKSQNQDDQATSQSNPTIARQEVPAAAKPIVQPASPSAGAKFNIENLRVFQLAKEIYLQKKISPTEKSPMTRRLERHWLQVFENLGRGFHAFGFTNKIHYYNEARSNVGAMIAILQVANRSFPQLQDDLLPALGALIRKIELNGQKPK